MLYHMSSNYLNFVEREPYYPTSCLIVDDYSYIFAKRTDNPCPVLGGGYLELGMTTYDLVDQLQPPAPFHKGGYGRGIHSGR